MAIRLSTGNFLFTFLFDLEESAKGRLDCLVAVLDVVVLPLPLLLLLLLPVAPMQLRLLLHVWHVRHAPGESGFPEEDAACGRPLSVVPSETLPTIEALNERPLTRDGSVGRGDAASQSQSLPTRKNIFCLGF